MIYSLIACCLIGAQDDLNEQVEKAMKDAVAKVSPSVVQIVTQGGLDLVVPTPKGPVFRKALGPTTGVIVGADGYVISSAFNFINNPTTILVAVPGIEEPLLAKKIATDKSKMLTLLQIEKTGLPVPAMTPKKEIIEGQWSIALGRTLDVKRNSPPVVSLGVISALNRIWGKAIQVDAKISPINYGGPIIDVQGRVQGILVPASPQGSDETAGFEWYDSGIGFAIPFEEVLAILPRLKQGKDLKKGLLGIRLKSADTNGPLSEIGEVTKGSAADRAGMKPGDLILEIDKHPVVRMAQVLHHLGPKYEGDKVLIKFRRDKKEIEKEVELVGNLETHAHPFLGILPMRDDSALGVEVRFVYPKSPADVAGLKEGDRIVKYGIEKLQAGFVGSKPGRLELLDFLNKKTPGDIVYLEVKRAGKDGKTETLNVTLGDLSEPIALLEKLPAESSKKEALKPLEVQGAKAPKIDPQKPPMVETGFSKKTLPTGEKYWVYVPRTYDPNVSHGLVVWLHQPGKTKDEDADDVIDNWSALCRENDMIVMGPLSENESGWVPSESDLVLDTVRDVLGRFTIDRQRVIAHGMGQGGQMATYLGMNHRDVVKGVASVGAPATGITDNLSNQRLSFFLAAGELDPLAKSIAESREKLTQKRYPAMYLPMPNRGREYLDNARLLDLVRWIDTLDKQ